MYYKINQVQNLINVDDTYATLKNIDENGTYTFELRYSIKTSDFSKINANNVLISVYTKSVIPKSIVDSSKANVTNSKEIISNILGDMSMRMNTSREKNLHVITSTNSDITTAIDNTTTRNLAIIKSPKTSIKLMSVGSIKDANKNIPVISTNVSKKDETSIDAKKLSYSLILKQGIDPSAIQFQSSKNLTTENGYAGTSPKLSGDFNPLVTQLQSTITDPLSNDSIKSSSDLEESKYVGIVTTSLNNVNVITKLLTFSIPEKSNASYDSMDVFVKFELIDSKTGNSLCVIDKKLDVLNHVNVYNTPIQSPIVKRVTSDHGSQAYIEITQLDQNANEIYIYKKDICIDTISDMSYELFDVVELLPNQKALVQVDIPLYNTTIYRVVSGHSGLRSFTYTNCVIKPKSYIPVRAISLSATGMATGVAIEAINIPTEVVSIQFLQRNLTILQKEFEKIGEPILIDEKMRSSDCVSIISNSVTNNNVYEFSSNLYFNDGIEYESGIDYIEYIAFEQQKVDIKITDVQVTSDKESPDISFNVSLSVIESNIDVVKALLEQQGIIDYFSNDVAKQREQLSSLLTYSVHRINLTTGEREDFGVMSTQNFVDSAVRKKYASSALVIGNKYRYVITAIIRVPETILQNLTKTIVDKVTKKPYTFNPSKFLHPYTLKTGVITTPIGLKIMNSKSELEHGIIGLNEFVDISLDDDIVNLSDPMVTKFDNETNVITWNVDGPIKIIDSFVISREINGINDVIAIAHNIFDDGNCKVFHKLTPHDIGEITYSITPIFNDYNQGTQIVTNSILEGVIA